MVLGAVAGYVADLEGAPLAARTRQAYASNVEGYGRWLTGRPAAEQALRVPRARDLATRDFKRFLKLERGWRPASVNLALAAVDHFNRPHPRHPAVYVRKRPGIPERVKLLIIATEVPDAASIREAADGEDVEIYVVVPALQNSPLRFWVSDVDDAIARARSIEEHTVAGLQDSDVALTVTGDVGDAEPLQAARDALAIFPADRILILTHEDQERAYREADLDSARAELNVPVTVRRVQQSSE